MKIRAKISLFAVALVAGVVAAIAANLAWVENRRARADFEAHVESLLDGVRRIARESVVAQDETMLMSYLKFLMKDYPEIEVAILGTKAHAVTIGSPKSEVVYRTVSVAEPKGEFFVKVGFSKTLEERKVRAAQWELAARVGALAGVGLLVGLAGALWLGALFAKPLAELARAAEEIGAGRLETTVAWRSDDELGDLAAHFNRMAARLSESLRFKEDLLSTLSHELNTPLSGLKGFLEYLTADDVGQTSLDRADSYRTMSEAVKQMEISLSNALALIKSERGEALQPEWFCPRDVVTEVIRLFAPTARVNEVELEGPRGDGFNETYSDKEMFRRLAINLASNAIKFTPPGGKVTITLKDFDDEVTLAVADTGPGIAAEHREMIFSKFYRVPAAGGRPQRIPGSGRGLAIAKHAAEAQGGRISVDSEVGKGSTFYVRVPRGKAPVPAGGKHALA